MQEMSIANLIRLDTYLVSVYHCSFSNQSLSNQYHCKHQYCHCHIASYRGVVCRHNGEWFAAVVKSSRCIELPTFGIDEVGDTDDARQLFSCLRCAASATARVLGLWHDFYTRDTNRTPA